MRATSAWTRPLVLYLFLVVLPTAALVGLSLGSLYREFRAARSLADANRRLMAEQFAAEIERLVTWETDGCLRAADLTNLRTAPPACPVVSRFFLVEGGMLRFPDHVDGAAARFVRDLRFVARYGTGTAQPVAYLAGEPAQFFYMPLPGPPPYRTIAAQVDLDRVTSDLLRNVRTTMGMMADIVPRQPGTSSCFRVLFPFWTIRVRSPEGEVSGQRNLALFGALHIAVILALGASAWELLRVYSRQWRMAELRSTFAGRFSHELKTPLANIRLYADLLRDGGTRDPDDERFAEIIAGQAEQLTRRVNRVLGATLIDQGRRKYDLRDADLARIVLQTVNRYRDWAAQQGFTLQVEAAPVGPVQCDPEAVAETLLNLLENAVKYSGSSRLVRVAVRQERDAVVVEVEDHGIGIPVADRERIFEEFYRAPNSKTAGGFGLGLFLARHVMEAHGGRIDVESESGQGSRFRLRFPTHANDPDR